MSEPAVIDPAAASRGQVRMRRRPDALSDPMALVAVGLLVCFVVLAIVAPFIWSRQANHVDTVALLRGSSSRHWLGTDDLGRDILARILVATRLSMELSLAATGIGLVVGLALGIAPSLIGRRLGGIVTASVNLALAFPGLLLILFFSVIFGVGIEGAVLSIGIAYGPVFARLTQTLAAGVTRSDYVAAARLAGAGRLRLALRHILPNIGETLIVNATISAGGVLLSFAALSFLGLGVQAPRYDWGELLNQGVNNLYQHPAGAIGPGVAVVLASLAFNLAGEAMAKRLGVSTDRPLRSSSPLRILSRRLARNDDPSPPVTASEPPVPAVLDVADLHVSFPGSAGEVEVVRGVSLAIAEGEAVGIVGESGSGKSQTALAIARLIEYPGRVTAARLRFRQTSLLDCSERTLRSLLGTSLAMVFQDPLSSLNPRLSVGRQLSEVTRHHEKASRRDSWNRAVDRLGDVGIPEPQRRAGQLPHEFSGGMRQRAVIGMGLMGDPTLVIADEPTTALDMTVQQRVLALLESIRTRRHAAILLISHDISVIEQFCDRLLVMYAGEIVEELPVTQLRTGARHPYTQALVAAVPDMTTNREGTLAAIPGRPVRPAEVGVGCAFAPRCPLADSGCRRQSPPLHSIADRHRVACWKAELTAVGWPTPSTAATPQAGGPTPRANAADVSRSEAGALLFEQVTVAFGSRRARLTAVDQVSLSIPAGATLGLVGESGSGKSTLARAAVGLTPLTDGQVLFDGRPVGRRGRRPPIQMIFQDPYSSLDPRMSVGQSISEALPRDGGRRSARAGEVRRLLELVDLDPTMARLRPSSLSGGQRQRVAVARVLAARPQVIIADEITSALDVSVQSTVLNLIRRLQHDLGLTMLFISHNLAVVRYVSDHVAVMQRGRIVEEGLTEHVFARAEHPYTRELLHAIPQPRTQPSIPQPVPSSLSRQPRSNLPL